MKITALADDFRSRFVRCAEQLFQSLLLQFLQKGITCGHLCLKSHSETLMFGQSQESAIADNQPVVHLRLNNAPYFFFRVATAADIGLAEAYMGNDFECTPHQLLQLFRLLIVNRDKMSLNVAQLALYNISAIYNRTSQWMHRNTIAGSANNVSAHYDLSNALFATFLGDTWTYSCAIFKQAHTPLDEAQIYKLDTIMDKATIDSSCHVLECGSGWGEFAIRTAQRFGCRVTGITLSHQQLSLAKQRAQQAGVQHLVQFHLLDYRNVQSLAMQFDRVVSIEMIEAVGHDFLPEYFQCMQSVLKPNGIMVAQVITTPEGRYDHYRSSMDFIQKYIFPGGLCPSFQALVDAAATARLCVHAVDNIGLHYARTLREWRLRFERGVTDGTVRAAGFDAVFSRMWRYYLCYCEAGFSSRTLSALQIVLTRAGSAALSD